MSYEEFIQQNCVSVPIIDTTVITKVDHQIFNLRVRAYQSKYEEGKFLHYYVGCNVPYHKEMWQYHPLKFVEFSDQTEISEIWEIVADNEFVRTILKFLTMSDLELQTKCGRVNQIEYRATLIQTLQNLWD